MTTIESAAGAVPAAPTDPVLTVEEAARYLRIGRTSMYALVSSGEVESVTIGRLRRIPRSALDDYVTRLRSARRAA
ncbi:helix-turn-helix domain-containing protein [Cryptosporangium arvum]|uniref:DNA-binding protein, excisionase family n=1 Tax=Cryptosporangium arvum DSM 44712 TaxID=927661 RepID=A0A010YVK5_9ACTN|nr:helix-turn-helix domain-containing protein [Cryptosporangium arvum]EXG79173.1 DNA-binding protein, excisionase family [Cryptosporangium arvum DSM 44712]